MTAVIADLLCMTCNRKLCYKGPVTIYGRAVDMNIDTNIVKEVLLCKRTPSNRMGDKLYIFVVESHDGKYETVRFNL